MKVLILTVLFAVLAGCYGYSYIIPPSMSMPGICFYNGKMLPQGDSQVPGVCQTTKCNPDGSIIIDGCGPITLPNCTLILDKATMASYPDCCDMTYQCVGPDGLPYTKVWNQLYPSGKGYEKVANIKEALQLLNAAKQAKAKKDGEEDPKVVQPLLLQLLLL